MARNVQSDRQFLANTPGLQFTKPLDQLSPSYVHRLAQSLRRQEEAGIPVSRQAARGHVVTPEHGKGGRGGARPKLPVAAEMYRGGKMPRSKYLRRTVSGTPKAPKGGIHKRPINGPERLDLSDGAVVFTEQDLVPVLLHLYNDAWEERVVLSGFDCERGIWRSIGINRGHGRGWTGGDMIERWNEAGGGRVISFEDWFISIANTTDSDPAQTFERIGHVCLWTVYIYPRNPHLRLRGA